MNIRPYAVAAACALLLAAPAFFENARNEPSRRGHAREVQVSLPRNLAHWPGFLALYWTVLAPLHENGSLAARTDAVLEDGSVRGTRLAATLGDTPEPSDEVRVGVLGSLENLVPNVMGRMIPVVSVLKTMLNSPSE